MINVAHGPLVKCFWKINLTREVILFFLKFKFRNVLWRLNTHWLRIIAVILFKYFIETFITDIFFSTFQISTDFLEDEITKFEDYVQSMDIAAFNKI